MTAILSERLVISDFLTPSSSGVTQLLIDASNANLLRTFLPFCDFLLGIEWIRARFGDAIGETVARLKDGGGESALHLMSSPIFRGWFAQFGKVENFDEPQKSIVSLLHDWGNSTASLGSGDFETVVSARSGVVWFSEPEFTFRSSARRSFWVRKKQNCLEVRASRAGELLTEFEVCQGKGFVDEAVTGKGSVEALLPRVIHGDPPVVFRNDIPALHLGFTGSLDRESAISAKSDSSVESYDPAWRHEDFIAASNLMASAWPAAYSDFCRLVRVVVPREVPRGWRARGMTVSSYQGAIWIMARGVGPIFENLLHEMSHVKLRYIEESLPIIAGRQIKERFKIGWRTDKRPIIGIFEGVYVHLNMLLGWASLREVESVFSAEVREERIAELGHEIDEGIKVLKENARFESGGEAFLSWAEETLGEFYF